MSSTPEHDIVAQATALQKDYSTDLSEAFPVQLVTFASSLQSEIAKLSSVKDLAHLLIVDYAAMTSAVTRRFCAADVSHLATHSRNCRKTFPKAAPHQEL